MDIKKILLENLEISELTASSLREGITSHFEGLSHPEKRRVAREIAHYAIKAAIDAGEVKDYGETGNFTSLPDTNVLGVNHTGPLDITLEWKTGSDGSLLLTECHVHSGGDQVNVSKVFSDFGKNIALVALAGKEGAPITDTWERSFLSKNIIPSLIREAKDQQVAVINIVDGEPLPVMFEWADALSTDTVESINSQTLNMLDEMFKKKNNTVWMVLSAGGPLRYDPVTACYAALIKQVKKKYHAKVEFLIDFMHIATSEESMSVLDIPRETPQDIIKPNVEEFIQLLESSGLIEKGSLDENTITEGAIKKHALELREKYNLLGILVSMDKSGLMLVMQDRIIRENGIKIIPKCHTAAGDSLKAGFLYALAEGRPFEEAVHTGNLFGASTASMPGTQTVTPAKLAEIDKLANEQDIKPEVELLR